MRKIITEEYYIVKVPVSYIIENGIALPRIVYIITLSYNREAFTLQTEILEKGKSSDNSKRNKEYKNLLKNFTWRFFGSKKIKFQINVNRFIGMMDKIKQNFIVQYKPIYTNLKEKDYYNFIALQSEIPIKRRNKSTKYYLGFVNKKIFGIYYKTKTEELIIKMSGQQCEEILLDLLNIVFPKFKSKYKYGLHSTNWIINRYAPSKRVRYTTALDKSKFNRIIKQFQILIEEFKNPQKYSFSKVTNLQKYIKF